jgi:hypothetical protein
MNFSHFSRTVVFASTILLLLFTGAIAQGPPPAAAKPGGTPIALVGQRSIQGMRPGERFSSADGRFSIALPKSISGFSALSPQQLGFNASGAMYQWIIKEGGVVITFHDFLDPNFAVTTEQNFTDYFAGVRDSVLQQTKGKMLSDSRITLAGHRGYQFAIELPGGRKGFARTFYVDKRAYSLFAVASEDPGAESLISKAFDSFELIAKGKVDADGQRRIEAATPAALPQSPFAAKERSDAEDEGLKGRVKTVTEESEDRSGTWGTQGRKMDSVEEYDARGFRTKRVDYDSKGMPFQITVYGYLDGARASKSNSIDYDDDPPLMAAGPPAPAAAAGKPRDTRYEYKYEHKYVAGRLNEKQLIRNDGRKGMRYVTTYDGNRSEELVYDDQGKLNMKFLYTLDSNGNPTERTYVDVLGNRGRDERYVVKYDSFDVEGNWTKSTTSKLVSDGGKDVYKEWYVTYRTFTYFH